MERASETTSMLAPPKPISLCPVCDSARLRVAGSVVVSYDVRIDGPQRELIVSGEAVAEDGWDATNAANCPVCGWSGTVADVSPLISQA